MNISQLNRIPTKIGSLDGVNSEITFTIPTDHIRSFMFMFQSMALLMQDIQWQSKCSEKQIHLRNDSKKIEIDARIEAYEKETCQTFKDYLNAGNTGREALSMTVSALYLHYSFASYDNIKKTLTKNKLLKNTGFYGSRHKMPS